ncbi:MAG TPA: hypothetical protein VG815_22230 [Chloroflexota bacterium]|nr:hypothetical protein [Chloroflexota bacterium]
MASLTVIRGSTTVEHPVDAVQTHVQPITTPHFAITYSASLGAGGAALAELIGSRCEQDFATLQQYFGDITPAGLPFQIKLTPGNTGASHADCAATELLIGALSVPANDTAFANSLVVAEEDEVFMANFGHGWDCGASNGEGLSRVVANDLYPGAEPSGFVSAPVWLDQGRPDFVNQTDPTDTNYLSIGCSVLFLNWLRFQLGQGWQQIIAAGGPTLADTYHNLGLPGVGWTAFVAQIDTMFPPGQPSGLTNDNPFPAP